MTTAQIVNIIFSYVLAILVGIIAATEDKDLGKGIGVLVILFIAAICGAYLS